MSVSLPNQRRYNLRIRKISSRAADLTNNLIERLPNEILFEIFLHLDLSVSLKNCALVSKRWHVLVSSEIFITSWICQHFDNPVDENFDREIAERFRFVVQANTSSRLFTSTGLAFFANQQANIGYSRYAGAEKNPDSSNAFIRTLKQRSLIVMTKTFCYQWRRSGNGRLCLVNFEQILGPNAGTVFEHVRPSLAIRLHNYRQNSWILNRLPITILDSEMKPIERCRLNLRDEDGLALLRNYPPTSRYLVIRHDLGCNFTIWFIKPGKILDEDHDFEPQTW